MSRTSVAVVLVLALAAAALAWGRGASAEPNAKDHRIVYLYVSGTGPQAKAWYDGAPPSGVQVQSALDRFAADGFRLGAVSSSGRSQVGAAAAALRPDEIAADYVVLLER